MFRDHTSTFKMAARLARWLCSSSERARNARADKDLMKRLHSIHAVLVRKSKMMAMNKQRGVGVIGDRSSKRVPAAECAVAIATLIHSISNSDI